MTSTDASDYTRAVLVGTAAELAGLQSGFNFFPGGTNYIPPEGQLLIESDTGIHRVGDGESRPADLPAVPTPGGGGGPKPACYFNLHQGSLGAASTLTLPATLADLFANMDWESTYQDPDTFWGSDVSAAQTALVIDSYGTSDTTGFGPFLPADGSQYWVEISLGGNLDVAAEALTVSALAFDGPLSGNLRGFMYAKAGDTPVFGSAAEVIVMYDESGPLKLRNRDPLDGDPVFANVQVSVSIVKISAG